MTIRITGPGGAVKFKGGGGVTRVFTPVYVSNFHLTWTSLAGSKTFGAGDVSYSSVLSSLSGAPIYTIVDPAFDPANIGGDTTITMTSWTTEPWATNAGAGVVGGAHLTGFGKDGLGGNVNLADPVTISLTPDWSGAKGVFIVTAVALPGGGSGSDLSGLLLVTAAELAAALPDVGPLDYFGEGSSGAFALSVVGGPSYDLTDPSVAQFSSQYSQALGTYVYTIWDAALSNAFDAGKQWQLTGFDVSPYAAGTHYAGMALLGLGDGGLVSGWTQDVSNSYPNSSVAHSITRYVTAASLNDAPNSSPPWGGLGGTSPVAGLVVITKNDGSGGDVAPITAILLFGPTQLL